MSEDRTQTPTKRRRQQAREQGLVARSPELTGAAVLLATVVLLGFWGERILAACVSAVREPLLGDPSLASSADEVVSWSRHVAFAAVVPLGVVLGGVLVVSVLVHQAQVQGLWSPGLLAPNPARLWSPTAGWGARAARGGWSLAKAAALIGVTGWAIQGGMSSFEQLSGMEIHALARASGSLLKGLATSLAIAVLVLGLLDYFLQWQRLESQLRLTTDEYREEQRAVDGDPAVRARRQRIARSWNRPSAVALESATLMLTGPGSLVVVLSGGPPPRPVTVRGSARGASGAALLQSAIHIGLHAVESPNLARHFARGGAASRSLTPKLAAELAAVWSPRT
jgi:flagellar biosynthesis protein FlhB